MCAISQRTTQARNLMLASSTTNDENLVISFAAELPRDFMFMWRRGCCLPTRTFVEGRLLEPSGCHIDRFKTKYRPQ